MKHIFLYNPAAGQGEAKALLEAAVAQHEGCELYVTRGPRDATAYIEERLAASPITRTPASPSTPVAAATIL